MNFEPGPTTEPLLHALSQGAKKGVDARLTYDWIAFKYHNADLHLTPIISPHNKKIFKRIDKHRKDILEGLTNSGVRVTVTNKPNITPRLVPIIKRNHTKIYAVDETVWLGGINFMDEGFNNIDFMVKTHQKKIVKAVLEHFTKVNKNKCKNNQKIQVTEAETLLTDAGKINNSIIYKIALESAQNANKKILFASQMLPDGPMLKHLIQKANQGLTVTVVTSNADQTKFHTLPYSVAYKKIKKKIANSSINLIHAVKKVHAKLLIVDEKEAIFGSHNLLQSGVLLGTEEIALKTTNQDLIFQLNNFIEKYCKSRLRF